VFASRELAGAKELHIGKTDSHVVLNSGNWTLYLPIDQQSHFPRIEQVIPVARKASDRSLRCRLLRRMMHRLRSISMAGP
jgi:hypothetical protein